MNPGVMSLGVIDGYLARRHGDVEISHPFLTVRNCYASPPVGPVATIHTITWQGQLTINLSYPEAVVKLGEEDLLAEQTSNRKGLLAWFEKFVEIFQSTAA